MEEYEIELHDEASFDKWEYDHFFKYEERVNVLQRKRQLSCDLHLFKSDFNNDLNYFDYLILKQKQLKYDR